jgi:hypothetical protein
LICKCARRTERGRAAREVLSVEAVNSLYYDQRNGYLHVGLTRADALRPAMETLTEVGMLLLVATAAGMLLVV